MALVLENERTPFLERDLTPGFAAHRGTLTRGAELGGLVLGFAGVGLVATWIGFYRLGRFDLIETEGLRGVVVAEMLEADPESREGLGGRIFSDADKNSAGKNFWDSADQQREFGGFTQIGAGSGRLPALGLPMPTLHHRPYLNKPPLYAWMEWGLARERGRLDTWGLRLPAAVSLMALALLLYGVGTAWGGAGCGWLAAALLLSNITVADYGCRAELDLPFTLFCTGSLLCVVPASGGGRMRSSAGWVGAYGLALTAALWKGPHSLIFLWLSLLGVWVWRRSGENGSIDREARNGVGASRRMATPLHVGCVVLVLAVLVGWAKVLAGFAGAQQVGGIAARELVERLIPYKPADWVAILIYPLTFLAITLPASALILAAAPWHGWSGKGRNEAAAAGRGLFYGAADRFRTMVKQSAPSERTRLILAMLAPNFLFLMIAPAKAPRYALPLFPLVCLLAGLWVVELLRGSVRVIATDKDGRRAGEEASHPLSVLLQWVRFCCCLAGCAAVLAAVVSLLGLWPPEGAVEIGQYWVWFAIAATMGVTFLWARRVRWPVETRWAATLLGIAVAGKLVAMECWWPMRERSDSQRQSAAAVDRAVPAGEPVFLLGKPDFPDTALYSFRAFHWIDEPGQAAGLSKLERPYFLMFKEQAAGGRGFPDYLSHPGTQVVLMFQRIEKDVVLFRMTLSVGTSGE